MTKLDSDKLIDAVNKLQKYDLFGDYDHYIDKTECGEYIMVDDIEDMINNMISDGGVETRLIRI